VVGAHTEPLELLEVLEVTEVEALELTEVEVLELTEVAPPEPPELLETEPLEVEPPVPASCPVLPCVAPPEVPHAQNHADARAPSAKKCECRGRG
jgi:hypothetical protein